MSVSPTARASLGRVALRLILTLVVSAACLGSAQAQLNNILNGQPLSPGVETGAPAVDGPESVISVRASFDAGNAERPGYLTVTATIAPPWYAYALTQKPVLATPTEIKLSPSPDYRLIGEFRPNLPAKVLEKEGHIFETHSGQVTWQAPLELKPGIDPTQVQISGRVRIQVCNDQSCLNPTNFDFTAVLAQNTPAAAPRATGVYSHPNIHATLRGQLVPAVAAPGTAVKLVISAEPSGNFHVYELTDRDPGTLGFKPTLIVLSNTSGFQVGRTEADTPVVKKQSDIPGAPPQHFYKGRVTWTTSITIPADAKPGPYPIAGLIGYQTCDDNGCDLPRGVRFDGTITVGSPGGKGTTPLAFSDAKYGEAAKLAAERPQMSSLPSGPVEPIEVQGLSSLPMVVLLSLIGGFILNFMPCVLPVIGLKILSFAEQAGRSRAQILTLNLWYSLGLLSVFWVLATFSSAVNLGLRESDLSWGEQFSSTAFNVTMVAIVFVMALSFLGVWEIPIPGFVGSGAANDLALREGPFGAFAKGIITTLLATPCSGPLLGAVLGYTLKQPPHITYLIFTCIGTGMASPYLLIGAFPRLIRFLPKPGAWMDTFKQIMGFMLLGTIVFFFSFMNRDYLVATFAFMIGLWAACWWIGRVSLVETLRRRLTAWGQGAAFASLVGVAAFTYLTPHESIIPWKTYSPAELARLTAEGNTVMVEFTADWCANCKTNLFVAIETAAVRDAIQQNKVVPMLADYTDGSAEIKEALEALKSKSIPLLAIFPAQDPQKPIVLRDLLTKQQVLDALHRAGPSKAEPAGKALTAAR